MLLSPGVIVKKLSSVYQTRPLGYEEQPMFLNMTCQVATSLAPRELLRLVKDIEARMGRKPGFPNFPRIIDIDILFYNARIIQTEELTIPHPRVAERAFVLIPLSEIAPGLVHPELGKKIAELARVVEGRNGVLKWTSGGLNVPAIHRGTF